MPIALRRLIKLGLLLFISGVILDAMLWHIDPLGARRYFQDLHDWNKLAEPHISGKIITPGSHQLNVFSATIHEDGSRDVPDTNLNADCVIAMLGDSLTFGWGVDDDDMWVNLLAQEFQDVTFINYARQGYEANNLLALYESIENDSNSKPDGYIWFIVNNDNQLTWLYERGTAGRVWPATLTYFRFFQRLGAEREKDWDSYWNAAKILITQPNMVVFGFEEDPLAQETHDTYEEVILVPEFTERISFADPHPNAEGHQQVFDTIAPDVEAFLNETCALSE